MKLALVNLTSGGLSGGYIKYLDRLLPLLRDDGSIRRLKVFMPPGTVQPTVEGIEWGSWTATRGLFASASLSEHVRAFDPDVVFVPTARWFDAGRPTLVMVRNMEPLTVPLEGNPPSEGLRNLARAFAARRACQRATRVIAVSAHVRDFLATRWAVPAAKIGVVYHGVEAVAEGAPERRPSAVPDGGPFIFTAGSIRPARGLEDVLRAMTALRVTHPSLRLVIGGKPDRAVAGYARRLQGLVRALGMESAIVWAGHLDSPEMTWCFRRCQAFVMTSRAEACPNIALEALSHGCALVSTTTPPMPEFFQGAASYYEPHNVQELATQIDHVLDASADVRSAAGARARERAGQFDWPRTARQTVAELQRTLSTS